MDNDADQTYIKLISADGTEIFLERRIALQVETIRAMLEGNFRESEEGGKLFCLLGSHNERYACVHGSFPDFILIVYIFSYSIP